MNSYDLVGEAYHQTIMDVDVLKMLAGYLPADPVIVNIGACFGTSAMALLEARPDAFVFSVDVSPSPLEVEHLTRAGLHQENRCCRCLGRSQDIGRFWPGRVNMVYIDGGHAYKDVIGDIEAWVPKVEPGGIVLFHDYGKPICPGVKPAVDERMLRYKLILAEDSMIAFLV